MTQYSTKGPVVIVPARLALKLARVLQLEEVRARYRSTDHELEALLSEWMSVAIDYAVTDCGNALAPDAATATSSKPEGMTTAQIERQFGIPARTTRYAAETGELHGDLTAGRWWFPLGEVNAWVNARPKDDNNP